MPTSFAGRRCGFRLFKRGVRRAAGMTAEKSLPPYIPAVQRLNRTCVNGEHRLECAKLVFGNLDIILEQMPLYPFRTGRRSQRPDVLIIP